jgi:hypothetical protein
MASSTRADSDGFHRKHISAKAHQLECIHLFTNCSKNHRIMAGRDVSAHLKLILLSHQLRMQSLAVSKSANIIGEG